MTTDRPKRRRRGFQRVPPEWTNAEHRAFHRERAECFALMATMHGADCQCVYCTPFPRRLT